MERKKRVIIVGIIIAVIFMIGAGVYYVTNVQNSSQSDGELNLLQDEFYSEYGEAVSVVARRYLDSTDATVMANAVMSVDIENQEDQDYPAMGSYLATITYDQEQVSFYIHVVDTIPPVFDETENQIITAGSAMSEDDFIALFNATDLTEVSMTVNMTDFDEQINGDYTIVATAYDSSNNEASYSINVTVTGNTTNQDDAHDESDNDSSSSDSSSDQNSSSTTDYTANMSAPEISYDAIALINDERAKLGLDSLEYSSTLGDLAIIRANEIQTVYNNDMASVYRNSGEYGYFAEMLSKHSKTAQYTASEVVTDWLASESEYKKLMDVDLKATGIAVAYMNNRWVALVSYDH
ncbi:CAP domain-containing protein [Tannockella kyphosi]|uniref:CAP domain-containing protein n=1 Tax=Tannockella kyphosi TaxID=2899121 RepID=UPI002011804C|nr:CAP domain-containing protein [Tannockella kyphosi]